jgi:hypothetical protein
MKLSHFCFALLKAGSIARSDDDGNRPGIQNVFKANKEYRRTSAKSASSAVQQVRYDRRRLSMESALCYRTSRTMKMKPQRSRRPQRIYP